jgi:tRNA pseudouridine38-40 synthase
MARFRIDLEYRGTAYRGWQAQKNAQGVANVLHTAVRKVFRDCGELVGAGRTDAGVHALQQVAHLEALPPQGKRDPRIALNDVLPPDIAVTRVAETKADFNARFDARERVYLYQILRRRSAFGPGQTWWIKDRLNLKDMKEAAKVLEGSHDFAAFSDKDPEKPKSTVLKLSPIEISEDGGLLLLRFRSQHFLWKMVRRLTGYLVECGRGRYKAGQTPQLFGQPSSVLAPYTAPPEGLYLERVLYSGETYDAPLRGVLNLPR